MTIKSIRWTNHNRRAFQVYRRILFRLYCDNEAR